ncbi:MAG: hypothetical protein ACRD6X_15965, partial [Pyrinomonadaceae bacterium]
MSVSVESANPAVKAILEGTAPRPAQLAASRGALPLPQNDLFEVLVGLSKSEDNELAANAKQTFSQLDQRLLEESVRAGDTPINFLSYIAECDGLAFKIYEGLLINPRTPAAAVENLAKITTSEPVLDMIAQNQQIMIKSPSIIDAIIANPIRSMEAARRATETKREFFEKERGAKQVANELRAQGNEAAAQFIERAEFESTDLTAEDAMIIAKMIESGDDETDDAWLALEYLEEIYE